MKVQSAHQVILLAEMAPEALIRTQHENRLQFVVLTTDLH